MLDESGNASKPEMLSTLWAACEPSDAEPPGAQPGTADLVGGQGKRKDRVRLRVF